MTISTRRLRLAHVADLHFGAEDAAVVRGLRADLAAQDVDRVLVGGDLTMRARAAQFRAARALLGSFDRPWMCVPGNHDVPLFRVVSRAVRPLGPYRRFVDAETQPLLRTPEMMVLGLSTPRRYLWRDGQIGAGQAARIRTAFEGSARLKVLMMHHPVFRPEQRPKETLTVGVDRALRAAAGAGVDLVLCGHGHVQAQVDLSATRTDLGRRMIGVMSGTACSRRTRAGESQSYTIVELSPDDRLCLRVRRWGDGRFRALSETGWRRTPDGWLPDAETAPGAPL
jgi:3',5'-cyclic AMP phosphodiesterase CpdA